jgi:hypothetical protein
MQAHRAGVVTNHLVILFFTQFKHPGFDTVYEVLGFGGFEHPFMHHFPDECAFMIKQQASG